MKKIVIYLYNISLGEINPSSFELVENSENIVRAKNQYPLEMRYFKKGLSGLLYPLELLLDSVNRDDIVREAKITPNDSLFDKLYKIAGVDVEPINGFVIKQK